MKKDLVSRTVRARRVKKFGRAVILFLLFAAACLLLNQGRWSSYRNSQFTGTCKYAEPAWTYRQGDTVLETGLTVPAFRHMEKGQSYSISVPLSYDGSADQTPTCFFFVDHMHCRVWLEDEILFSYMPGEVEKTDRAKSPGNVYVAAPLPNDCLGKTLTIEFVPALDADIEYQLPNPTFGDYATQMAATFWEELPHNVIAVLALFLGIGVVVFSTLAMSGANYREGLFIGIFAVLFGIYNMTESDFDFYMISNPYYTYVLDYFTFSLMPAVLIAFLRERMDRMRRRISLVTILASLALTVLEFTLHFTGAMDAREFLPIIHISYFAAFIINFLLLATMKKDRRKTQLILQLIPIMLGMLVDVSVYYLHWQLGSSDSTFTALGVIIFVIAELCHVWKYSIEVYTESMRSRVYQQMAYVDSLTGIGNHRSFEMEKSAIIDGRKSFDSLVIVSADLNNLKTTNDGMGHASGDFLIRSAANVLADFAADYGQPFRIGGDEFIVFLYNIPPEEIDRRLEQMKKQIEAINSNSLAKLSLAVGVQRCHANLEASIAEADQKMYANKARCKEKELRS